MHNNRSLLIRVQSNQARRAYSYTIQLDVDDLNIPATGSANYQNNTHETEQDPPSYENITSQTGAPNPAYVNPMGDGHVGLPTVTETGCGPDGGDPELSMTPERRKKMLRNLYIILGILVIVHIIWIVAVAVSLNKAGDYDDYY
ncbi:unnamed protein product [Ambrosiozyma monospora]|uniref:Unnamed protein product n=1 Tax=Ambrosiozyma monospora TaxID=43982 RepID=A0A9W7DEP7_AMBMO|nr:unnamed protein product [Ambrosiozyma monospora]